MAEEQKELTPRNYQVALLQRCLEQNTIIFLPTGAGKTFIAVMAMKRMSSQLIGENPKVSIVLVNTVALVDQHVKYIRQHTPFECAGFSGEMNVDVWDKNTWLREFKKNNVMVMTCEILNIIIRSQIADLNMVNLLIFDECHHAVDDHSMRQVMSNYPNLREPPRIIGLTATLINRNVTPYEVTEEVRTLERTFHSKVAAVDGLEVVVGFATDPWQGLFPYTSGVTSPTVSGLAKLQCLEKLDSLLHQLSKCAIECLEVDKRLRNPNLKPLDSKDALKRTMNAIKDLKLHIEVFGVYGGRIACVAHNIGIERMKKKCDNLKMMYLLNYTQTVIGHINSRFINCMKNCETEKERFIQFSSDKTLTLISILKDFKENSKEELCGIIFVDRKFTARILFHILERLSTCDPDFSYIRSDYIIGNNNNPFNDSREGLFLTKKNRQVIERFINKETNLICSSQVLEEGIDIPKCTFVCKFDLPKDYRSYVQSKGRARHKTSRYYMMVDESKLQKFTRQLENIKEVEETLNELLIGKNDEREAPTMDEIDAMNSGQLIPRYYVNGPGSAYIDLVSAIPLLCRYCQSLPSDQYTDVDPEWYIEDISTPKGCMYSVTILMPLICPIIDPIVGREMRSKKMAKRAAAYAACVKLYESGELNEYLLPIERKVAEEDVSFLFEHYPAEKEKNAGGKLARMHELQRPKATSGRIHPNTDVFLHIINMTPLYSRSKDNINDQAMFDMIANEYRFGIITPKPLPNTFSHPIYVSTGTIMVSIVNNFRTIRLTPEQLEKVTEFHFIVFNDLLEVLNPFLIHDLSEDAEALLLVPLNSNNTFEIDFKMIEEKKNVESREFDFSHEEKLSLEVNTDTYLHKIVMPTYRRDITTYLVTRVCSDMSPSTPFPSDNFRDFIDYYGSKHQIHIVNRQQPLLFVKGISKKLNLFKPQGLEKKRKKEKIYEEMEEYLIPELLVKQDFPAALWIQARFLPTILSRLSFTLRVETLWTEIGNKCGFPLKIKNMKQLQLNLDLLKYDPFMNEIEQTNSVKRNYETSEGLLALPTSLKSSTCNRDFKAKILESKYPWKDIEEPKDINRTLQVSVMDIEAYENFINHKVKDVERQDVHRSPQRSKYPALTYNKEFVPRKIKMLDGNHAGLVELADLYEAMTSSKANDIVNLERLETLGDSFLKYISSFYISLRFPQYDEGRATQLKSRLISNKNLFYLARKHKIGGIMKNKDLQAKDEWLPPGFGIAERLRKEIDRKVVSVKSLFRSEFSREERITGRVNDANMDTLLENYPLGEEEEESLYENLGQFLNKQSLRDKCVADVVEAILGTYLLGTGIEGCLKVIQFLGIIPPSENLQQLLQTRPPNPLLKPGAHQMDVIFHLPMFNEIEKIIDYRFNNKGYLLQALTHASYTPNRLTQSYERLEFLGDAILDFLITCFIYETCGALTPGELTDLRSALVNNNTFASYVVRLGLHKFLLMMNTKLQTHIDKFDEFLTMKNFQIDDEVLILLEEGDVNLAEYVDVPKVLGDIFEALVGAVFLDSGYDLEMVWKVFYKLMWTEIDLFSRNVPKNMVRRLFESEGAYPEFGKTQVIDNDRVMIKLHFYAEGRPKFVYGFGSNKVLAKKAAAKIALKYL